MPPQGGRGAARREQKCFNDGRRNDMGTVAPTPDIRQTRQPSGLYERDFYSWTGQQAEALRRRDLAAVDWDNVIEEIEALGKAQQHSWQAFCARVLEYLLKIEYRDYAGKEALRHWEDEIGIFRYHMVELIDENPGLKGRYAEMFAAAWKRGRYLAVKKFKKYDREHRGEDCAKPPRKWNDILPQECPYRLEEVTAYDPRRDREPRDDVWPPSVARVLNTRMNAGFPIRADRAPDRGMGWDR